jgi:hydroxymethylpyrimidine pyrophosphatase-like HAD family hydrolase
MYSLDGSSIVKKVPNQAYLIATRNSTSPSGFFAFDIASKSQKSYSHMDLTNFWMSEDGQYIYAQNSNIYRTTSSTGSSDKFNTNINAIGKINFDSGNTYGLKFIYQSNHFLWVIQNDSYSSDSPTSIYQFEDNDYTLVKNYAYNLLYQPDAQSASFTVNANYVFANNKGTEISVLCKGTSNNSWVIQFVPVQ